jgi:hypothetical protein
MGRIIMAQDNKSDTPESSTLSNSVIGDFMANLANEQTRTHHNEQAVDMLDAVLTNKPITEAHKPIIPDIDSPTDILNAAFADKPNNAKPKQNTSDDAALQNNSPGAGSSPQQEFAKATLFSTSKVPLIVYGAVALLLFVCGQFPTVFAGLLFTPDEQLELPGFILNNLPTVFTGFFFLLAAGAIYLGIKESFTGKLNVFQDYLAFKNSLFRSDKIHYADLRSIVVHRSPYSLFGDIGHLEVMGKNKEFIFKNVSKPFKLKETLLERKNNYLNND